jgi:glycosyltransferase involved in cell wall biosynthesis
MPDRKLVVIGEGPQFKRIKALAGPNVTLLGYQPFDVLRSHLQRARAFIFAAEEDFGVAPLEAQACGTPVLAFGKGGALETVVDGVTGLHFHEQTADAIRDVVERFERLPVDFFDPEALRVHADQFSTKNFRAQFRAYVDSRWAEHLAWLATGAPNVAEEIAGPSRPEKVQPQGARKELIRLVPKSISEGAR